MIESNKELFQNIYEIIKKLQLSGKKDYAKNLEDALIISTVPGEILGETRLVLEKLRREGVAAEANVQKEVLDSMKYLEKIL